MKVKDYKKYCSLLHAEQPKERIPCFYGLGEIVTKVTEDGVKIGVVVQLHDANNFRTDMFGDVNFLEVNTSTFEEVCMYRDELLDDMFTYPYAERNYMEAIKLIRKLIEKPSK